MTGWICVHRKIQENAIWKDKPFSKGQAWIDLLLLANYEDSKVLIENKLIMVRRGEKITSLRTLAKRWGWSRTKVNNFLFALEDEKMIEVKKDSKKTAYYIINYDYYQDAENRAKNSEETLKEPLKEPVKETVKETKKKQKRNTSNYTNSNDYKELWEQKGNKKEPVKEPLKEPLKEPVTENNLKKLNNEEPVKEPLQTMQISTDTRDWEATKRASEKPLKEPVKNSLKNAENSQICDTENEPKSHQKSTNNNIYNNNNNHRLVLCRTFLDRIKNDWNDLPDPIAKITNISPGTKRYDFLKARLNDYGEDEILRAIKNIHESDFLQGKNNMGWRITFDWFIKPNNFIKVLENNYKNNTNTNTNTSTGNKTYNKKPSYNWQQAQSNRQSTEDIENKLKQRQMEMIKNVLNGSDNHGV